MAEMDRLTAEAMRLLDQLEPVMKRLRVVERTASDLDAFSGEKENDPTPVDPVLNRVERMSW